MLLNQNQLEAMASRMLRADEVFEIEGEVDYVAKCPKFERASELGSERKSLYIDREDLECSNIREVSGNVIVTYGHPVASPVSDIYPVRNSSVAIPVDREHFYSAEDAKSSWVDVSIFEIVSDAVDLKNAAIVSRAEVKSLENAYALELSMMNNLESKEDSLHKEHLAPKLSDALYAILKDDWLAKKSVDNVDKSQSAINAARIRDVAMGLKEAEVKALESSKSSLIDVAEAQFEGLGSIDEAFANVKGKKQVKIIKMFNPNEEAIIKWSLGSVSKDVNPQVSISEFLKMIDAKDRIEIMKIARGDKSVKIYAKEFEEFISLYIYKGGVMIDALGVYKS